jgi:Spy/CpxP family protein refolding chaperone
LVARYYNTYYTVHMMVTFRADPEIEAALAELTAGGRSRTEVIKAAVIEAARAQRREELRAEAAALAADPEDVAEIRAVREEMDALRAR